MTMKNHPEGWDEDDYTQDAMSGKALTLDAVRRAASLEAERLTPQNDPFACGICGFVAPPVGTRHAQSAIAANHYQEDHDD